MYVKYLCTFFVPQDDYMRNEILREEELIYTCARPSTDCQLRRKTAGVTDFFSVKVESPLPLPIPHSFARQAPWKTLQYRQGFIWLAYSFWHMFQHKHDSRSRYPTICLSDFLFRTTLLPRTYTIPGSKTAENPSRRRGNLSCETRSEYTYQWLEESMAMAVRIG